MNKQIITKIEETIENSVDRYKSILSIPRTVNKEFIEDLEYILLIVYNSIELSEDDFLNKLKEYYGIANNTAINVRPTLERANLLMKVSNSIRLTKQAKNYFETKEVAYLAKGFIDNYFGFLEILLLIEKKKPRKRSFIFNEWKNMYDELYDPRSESTQQSQFSIIYRYLIGLEIIKEDKNGLSINEPVLNKLMEIEIF